MEPNINAELQNITKRLSELEKQNRFYRKLLFFSFIFILGAGVAAWQAGEIKEGYLELRELSIIDKKGKKRAVLSEDTLKFFDVKGKPTMIIDSKSLEIEHLFIKDELGVIRSKIFNSKIELLDKDGKLQTTLNGESIEMYHKGKLTLNPSVLSFNKFSDKGEIPSVNIYPLVPELTFFDPKGSGKFVVNINKFGVYYFDPEKKSRINLNPAGIDYYDGNTNRNKKWP